MSKVKYYHLFADGTDSNGVKHTVTVVGKFVQEYVQKQVTEDTTVEYKPNHAVNGKLTYNKKRLHRKLTLGVAICNPSDDFNEDEGVRVGKRRIKEGKDAGTVETNDITMLTEDLILAEMLGKLCYVTKHIDKYIKKQDRIDDIEMQAIGI